MAEDFPKIEELKPFGGGRPPVKPGLVAEKLEPVDATSPFFLAEAEFDFADGDDAATVLATGKRQHLPFRLVRPDTDASADGPRCDPEDDFATYPEDGVWESGRGATTETSVLNFEQIQFDL